MKIDAPAPSSALIRDYVFSSNSDAVRNILKTVLKDLQIVGLSADQITSVEIILAEVFNNIIEHAYLFEKDRAIALACVRHPNTLSFQFIDQGRPMPSDKVPLPTSYVKFGKLCDLPEGGFGWNIIRSLANDISYQRRDNSNFLKISVKLD